MKELFFVFSLVIGLGLLTYGMVVVALKMDISEDDFETDGIKDMVEIIKGANPGIKFTIIFMLGGMMLSEIAVKLINLPFAIFTAVFTKKSV